MSPLKWWVGHAGFSHLRHTAQGTQVLNQLLKDPTKIMGLACLLFFRLGQTKMSHKYQKASNMQICTAKNQNIYPTPACWRIQLHQQNSWVTPVWAPSFLSPSRLLGMKVLGFLSENCLQGLSISCVNFQERDGRKLWSFTFLSNPSCWRKLTFSPPPLFLSFSWEKEICTHSSRLSASHGTTSLEDNWHHSMLLILPKRPAATMGSRGTTASPPATKLPASAAEQTAGLANFTLQLLGKVFQLLICITLSCFPRNISDIANSSFKNEIK